MCYLFTEFYLVRTYQVGAVPSVINWTSGYLAVVWSRDDLFRWWRSYLLPQNNTPFPTRHCCSSSGNVVVNNPPQNPCVNWKNVLVMFYFIQIQRHSEIMIKFYSRAILLCPKLSVRTLSWQTYLYLSFISTPLLYTSTSRLSVSIKVTMLRNFKSCLFCIVSNTLISVYTTDQWIVVLQSSAPSIGCCNMHCTYELYSNLDKFETSLKLIITRLSSSVII